MLVLTDIQKATLSISAVDAAGNPAELDGAPTWSTSDSSVLMVEASADGLSAVITAVGPLGSAQASVSADARMGEEVSTLTGTLDVDVVASEATALNISAGAPEPK